ncbi:hypothetical protein B0H21DRAFT_692405 [Amylocystis lapponica]|nr:hypothetical protein B0H21DRAFT_692405 [Amylocystis lapponica]
MSLAQTAQHTSTATVPNVKAQAPVPQECLTCRIIGTAALGGVGIYALKMSRAKAPGSIAGKRIVAGLGICFLAASALRWSK